MIDAIAVALHSALLRDLPDTEARLYTVAGAEKLSPPRRPREDEVEVFVWPETWGSTALGYGGLGGNMVTTDYTIVVTMNHRSLASVLGRGWSTRVPNRERQRGGSNSR